MGYEVNIIEDISVKNPRQTLDLGRIELKLGNQLNEVTVKAERSTVINKIDRQVFEANKFKSAQGGSGIDVVRNLPSVTVDSQGEINVRGSAGFVVLLNGKPFQGNATALLAQLPANAIERVEVITAPSAKYDPEGKGGILNITTKKGAVDGAYGLINLRGGFPSIETYGNADPHQRYGADATYNVRNEKWNLSLGANYQRNDIGGRREGDVFTIIDGVKIRFPSTGERSIDEINYSGRLNIDFTPDMNNEFSFGLFAGKRSRERLADIVYFDNHAVSPADSDN